MKKERGIYKRVDIYWISYAGIDGKIRRESSRSNRKKDAQELLIRRKNEVLDGKSAHPRRKIGNHSFKDLVIPYLKFIETLRSYDSRKYLVQNLENEFGGLALTRFNTKLIDEFQAKVLKGDIGKTGRKLTPATYNRYLACLKHMFAKAIDWDMIDEESPKWLKRAKHLKEPEGRLRYLHPEECDKLITACDHHLKPIVITALNTGMRKEEILSLQWEKNIDLKNGYILLQKTKSNETRQVQINSTLLVVLKGLRGFGKGPFVFANNDGNRLKDIRKSFSSALRRSGIKDFTFHDLRHTFASQAVMAGVDLPTLKDWMGHKTLKMTLRYAHLAEGFKREKMDLFDKRMNQEEGTQKVHNLEKDKIVKIK
jgi:integrase